MKKKEYNDELKSYSNLRELLHPGSYIDVRRWLKRESVNLSDKEFDNMALNAIIQATDSKMHTDIEKALKILNQKLKDYIHKEPV